ncbi:MAG TPA: hypothetical protein VJ747_03955 [Stellaceae bacterium]|nr:hypothetical protein [Stellaceae bacterium]
MPMTSQAQKPPSLTAVPAPSAKLADYVSLCLAMWNDDSDTASRASALGLQDMAGIGAAITIGKTTLRGFRSNPNRGSVFTMSTRFSDSSKTSTCDVAMPRTIVRAELETLEKDLDLDGQIVTLGPAAMGQWKMRARQPAIFLKVASGNGNLLLSVQQSESTLDAARAKAHAASPKSR